MTKRLQLTIIGQGEPLILLHGWGWHSGIWSPLVPELSQNFQLFLIDLPGFGKNAHFNYPYTINEIAELIFEVVPKQASWLGWSLGGMIAWWVALNYPNKITQLITVGSSPKFVAEKDWPGISSLVLEKFRHSIITDYHQTLYDFLDLQLRGSPNSQKLFATLRQQVPPDSPIEALLGSLDLLHSIDLRPDLHKIACPSLHIFGSHDTLVPKEIAERIQHGRCEIIKRTGHLPFLTHSELFFSYFIPSHDR